MDKASTTLIDYATPGTPSRPPNPDEPMALVLGIIAVVLGAVSLFVLLRLRQYEFDVLLGAQANLLGLVSGGVGWGLSRHSRPNASYRTCAWANIFNWLGLAALIFDAARK